MKVSSASLTVNEGRGRTSYRVTLNKAPKVGETVRLDWYLDIWSAAVLIDYDGEGNCYNFGDFTRENWIAAAAPSRCRRKRTKTRTMRSA